MALIGFRSPPELAEGRRWSRVSRATPCQICQKPDGCLLAPDGATALCIRISSDSPVPAQRGLGGWYHRLAEGSSRPLPPIPDRPLLGRPLASLADRHRVYQALVDELGLTLAHRRHLTEKRRMTLAQAAALGYASLPSEEYRRQAVAQHLQDRFGEDLLLTVPGFVRVRGHLTLAGASGILIPARSAEGLIQAFQIRRDHERKSKYVWFSSAAHHGPSSGALCHVARPLQGTSSPCVWVTEGPLKADLASQLLVAQAVAIPGVGACRDLPTVLHALQLDQAEPLEVVVALDADWQTKPQVGQARARIAETLAQAGYTVHLADWSAQEAKGLDDLLQRGFAPVLEPYRAHTSGPRRFEERAPSAAPATEPGWTVEKLRRELPRRLDQALKTPASRPQSLLVRTPPGTGKTHALTAALNRMASTTRKNAAVFVPRHALAQGEGRENWSHVHGRGHAPENSGKPCAFSDRLDKVIKLRISPSQACQACPLLQTCRENAQCAGAHEPWYWAQFSHLKRVAVFPAEHLLHADFWDGASVVVLDDVDLTQLLLETVTITFDDLRQTLQLLDHPEYQGMLPAQPLLQLLFDWIHHLDRADNPYLRSSDQWLAEWARWTSTHRMELAEAVDQALQAEEPELFKKGDDLRQVSLARPKRFLLDLARVIRHELAQLAAGRAWNSRLTLRKHESHLVLDLHLRKDLPKGAFAGKTLIVTNASATREDLEQLFPDRDWDVFEPAVTIPDGVEVIQIPDRNYGKTHLRPPAEALVNTHAPYLKVKQDLEMMIRSHRARGHRLGAITHLPFKPILHRMLPELDVTGHYFGQRGSNAFENCQALFVVGTPWPNPTDLLQQARTLYWDGPVLSNAERLHKRRLGRSPNGHDLWTTVRTYADPRLQRLLEARREEELYQAVGRARLFNLNTASGHQLDLFTEPDPQKVDRERITVYVFSGLPLKGLDRIQVRSDRVLEEARLRWAAEEMQAEGVALSRRGLALRAPASQRQAAQWLSLWRAQGSPILRSTRDPLGEERLSPSSWIDPPGSPEDYRGPAKAFPNELSWVQTGEVDRVIGGSVNSERSTSPESTPQTLCAKGGSDPRYEEMASNGDPNSSASSEGRSRVDHPLDRPLKLEGERALAQAADRLQAQRLPISRRKLAREAQLSERQAAKYLKNGPPRLAFPDPIGPADPPRPLLRARLLGKEPELSQAALELRDRGISLSRRKLAQAAATSERQAQNWLRLALPLHGETG